MLGFVDVICTKIKFQRIMGELSVKTIVHSQIDNTVSAELAPNIFYALNARKVREHFDTLILLRIYYLWTNIASLRLGILIL